MVEVTAQSILSRFIVGFEYDLTWNEVREKTRARRKKVDTKPKK